MKSRASLIASIIILLLCFPLLAHRARDMGFAKGYKEGYTLGRSEWEDLRTSNLMRIDHPLIDYRLNDGAKWAVVLDEGSLYGHSEDVRILEKCKIMNPFKDTLSIKTFTVGLGTTPDGYVRVYRNGKLVEDVPYCGSAKITDPILEKFFKRVSREYAEKVIGGNLPRVD